MRLFVLGATGKTGQALVAKTFHAVVGNPMRADDLATALPGHDAVLSVLGTRGLGATSGVDAAATGIHQAVRGGGCLPEPRRAALHLPVAAIHRLIATNWIRTIAYWLIAILGTVIVTRLVAVTAARS
jgi:hypothetical protein